MIEEIIRGIQQLVSSVGAWGYLIIFFAAFLESSAFMGLLVPGETIVVLSGFLAYQGFLDLIDCLWVIALGAVLGDTVGYVLGRLIGRGYFERRERLLFLKLKHIRKADGYFKRHGGKTIFFGRFVGLLRAMAPFAAGMSRMRYGRFLAYNLAGGLLWAVIFTLLGYYFGKSWQLIEMWSGRVGIFIAFIALVIAGFALLYRRLIRRREEIYQWLAERYHAFQYSRRVQRFIAGHPALVSFVKERLSPEGYLGLHLAVGLAVSAVFVWVLGGITEDILTGDPFVQVDRWVLLHVLYLRTPVATDVMSAFTLLGGRNFIVMGSLAVIASLLLRKRFNLIVGYLSAVVGGTILVVVLKAAVHRVRPLSETSLAYAAGWSFPSGHSMMSVIFYGMIAYFLIRSVYSWKAGVLLSISAAFVVFLIGFSRIYLQVHFLSDVLAGYAGGLFWLTICITGLEVYRIRMLHRGKGG